MINRLMMNCLVLNPLTRFGSCAAAVTVTVHQIQSGLNSSIASATSWRTRYRFSGSGRILVE